MLSNYWGPLLAGLLMILDYGWWPVVALVGGAIYIDTAGREAVKILSFKKEGFNLGAKKQQQLFFASYIVMAMLGVVVVCFALLNVMSGCSAGCD